MSCVPAYEGVIVRVPTALWRGEDATAHCENIHSCSSYGT